MHKTHIFDQKKNDFFTDLPTLFFTNNFFFRPNDHLMVYIGVVRGGGGGHVNHICPEVVGIAVEYKQQTRTTGQRVVRTLASAGVVFGYLGMFRADKWYG